MISTDSIIPFLKPSSFVSSILYFDELESTNDFLKIGKDIEDGTLVITNYQTKGRGRFERRWESEKGKNLTFSILKKIEIKPEHQINLVYFFSNIIYSALWKKISDFEASSREIQLKIKWPNDILLNDKKIGGILIETVPGTMKYIIGIGINANQESFTPEILNTATSLFIETGKYYDLNKLLLDIINEINDNLYLLNDHKYREICSLWKERTQCIGKEVTYLMLNGEKRKGIILDFSLEGKILLSSNGNIYSYSSSDIQLHI